MSLSATCFFFFSSRRRHTRLQGDWSSDVCSSDLARAVGGARQRGGRGPQACDGPRQPVSPDAPARPRAAAERGGMTRLAGPAPASSLAAVLRVLTREAAHPMHLSSAPPTRMPVMRVLLLVVLCALGPAVAAAQDTAIVIQPESAGVMVPPPELPHAVAEDAVRRYNAATTTRLVGRSRLPHGNEWRGDVAVRNGVVVVAGRVEGTLLVINGDAILDSSGVVTGDVIVAGGTGAGSPAALMSGELRVYSAPLAYRTKGEEIALAPPDWRRWFRRLGIEKSWGTADSRSSLTLATGGTFNRVEGLPVVFGPLFDWKLHRNLRLRVDALGVFRTAGDFTHKRSDLGYLLRTELRSGEAPAYGIELRAFDDVTPVEDWGLRAGEVGWSAFLFQRDYRDYYLSKGVAVRAFVQPERSLRLDIRSEEHTSELQSPCNLVCRLLLEKKKSASRQCSLPP